MVLVVVLFAGSVLGFGSGWIHRWRDFRRGGLVWVAAELAIGPTAGSRIRTTGASVDLPLVARTRRARKVLA